MEQKPRPVTATRRYLAKLFLWDEEVFRKRLRDLGICHGKKLTPKEIDIIFDTWGDPRR